ncbi:hypothetical protein ACH4KN_33955 [Streptomyces sp. NPDC017546]|uniref:hypothetical protein n=1 Tax=Streptomyces sp. NPDC017546 TaxID=3365001 RepID=UPI0037B9AA3B
MPDNTPASDRPADQLRAAVWVDGDPLMEAMAAAVYEQCDRHPEVSVTIDDPRTIAAVAATVARQLLGTTTTEEQEPVQLRWGLDDVMYGDDDTTTVLLSGPGREPYWVELDPERTAALRDALAGPATPPAPVGRAAILHEAADFTETLRQFTPATGARKGAQVSENVGILRVADHLRRLADEAAAGVQPPTEGEESDGTALRRYAGRMAALDRLCSGRPGYHAVTVKQVLTAMSDADDEQAAAPAAPEEPTR